MILSSTDCKYVDVLFTDHYSNRCKRKVEIVLDSARF